MTSLLPNGVVRLPLVLIITAAWFGISNHCALGALQHVSGMQMPKCHATAPGNPTPVRQDQQGGVECCKVLRATLVMPSSGLAAADTFAFVSHIYLVSFIPTADHSQPGRFSEWNTGPPGAVSFAESVLQRSILAHAPPLSLS
ncbi:MAG: hypothetical protein DMF03_06380 [Verrucomicrobia bacterium]|nr:MAG: hypothetical protein DMF03_06380 [Verrucomicrobiota bacterium]